MKLCGLLLQMYAKFAYLVANCLILFRDYVQIQHICCGISSISFSGYKIKILGKANLIFFIYISHKSLIFIYSSSCLAICSDIIKIIPEIG